MIAAGVLSAAWALSEAVRPATGTWEGVIRHDPGFVVLAFAFNPLVVSSVGLGAHPDAVVAAAFGGAILAERRRHAWTTTLLLAVAALVKVYAALVLIAWLLCLVRRRGARTAAAHAVSAAVLGVWCYLPFWRGLSTFRGLRPMERSASASLTGVILRLESGHPADAFAAGSSPACVVVRGAATALVCLVAIGVARSARTRNEPWRAAALLFGAYLLLTPWYLPWDVTGLLALAVVVSDDVVTWSTVVFSGSSLVVGGGLLAQTVIRYGSVLGVATWPMRPHTSRQRPHRPPGRGVLPHVGDLAGVIRPSLTRPSGSVHPDLFRHRLGDGDLVSSDCHRDHAGARVEADHLHLDVEPHPMVGEEAKERRRLVLGRLRDAPHLGPVPRS